MADPTRKTFFAGTLAVYAAAFWGQQGFLELCERFKLLQRYKIQKSKHADPALVRSAYRDVLVSHAISVPLSLWFLGGFFKKRGMQFSLKRLPSFSQILAKLFMWHVLFDTWFYWAHRLFHTKWLYKRFHKQHHRFTTPVGIAASYAHPVEDLVVNIGSTFVGPLVFPSHFIVWLLYIGMRFHEVRNVLFMQTLFTLASPCITSYIHTAYTENKLCMHAFLMHTRVSHCSLVCRLSMRIVATTSRGHRGELWGNFTAVHGATTGTTAIRFVSVITV